MNRFEPLADGWYSASWNGPCHLFISSGTCKVYATEMFLVDTELTVEKLVSLSPRELMELVIIKNHFGWLKNYFNIDAGWASGSFGLAFDFKSLRIVRSTNEWDEHLELQ